MMKTMFMVLVLGMTTMSQVFSQEIDTSVENERTSDEQVVSQEDQDAAAEIDQSEQRNIRQALRNYFGRPEVHRVGAGIGVAEGLALNGNIDFDLGEGRDHYGFNAILGLGGIAVRGQFATDYLNWNRDISVGRAEGEIRITPAHARILLGTIGFYLAAEPEVTANLRAEFRRNKAVIDLEVLAELGAALGVGCDGSDCSGVIGALVGVAGSAEVRVLPVRLLRKLKIYVDFMFRGVLGVSPRTSRSSLIDAGLRILNDNGCERYSVGFRSSNEGGLPFNGIVFSMPLGGDSNRVCTDLGESDRDRSIEEDSRDEYESEDDDSAAASRE